MLRIRNTLARKDGWQNFAKLSTFSDIFLYDDDKRIACVLLTVVAEIKAVWRGRLSLP